jgi:hypothetical protein
MLNRRARLYTLPIVVMIAFLSVIGLAAWRRADLIATLSEQLSHQNHADARAAVRQLAAFTNPPLQLLVEAAACDDHDTAESAQVAITQLLDEWQHHVDNGQHISRIAEQATELASVLASERRTFPTTVYPWLESITRELARVAAKCPPKKTPLLAMHCDEIMSLILHANFAPTSSVGASTPANSPKPAIVPPPANDIGSDARLEQAFTAFPAAPNEFRSQPRDQASTPARIQVDEDGRLNQPGNALRPEGRGISQGVLAQGDNGGSNSQLPPLNGSQGRPDWLQPSYQISPSMEESTERHDSKANSAPQTLSNGLGTYSTRELFERWRTTTGDDHHDIEQQLAARGFKHLQPAIIEEYLSDELAVRLRIVSTIQKQPAGDVRPWLFLLAEDDETEVRLLAVTVMATSDDRALIEKAWQISIRDRDPRIADLAAHLRDRRAGTQFR